MLDSGNNVIKNHRIENDTNLYFKNMRFVKNNIVIRNIKLAKVDTSKRLLEIG